MKIFALLTITANLRITERIVVSKEERLLEALKTEPDRTIERIYRRYKPGFLKYVRRFGGVREDHTEVYHDAILGFYDMFVSGRYDASKASVKTLIYKIGKYRLLTRIRKEQPWDVDLERIQIAAPEAEEYEHPQLDKIKHALQELGEGCREIIRLFYYQNLSIADIVKRLGYKNENVVKAHKSRCMKQLRKKVQRKSTGS